MVLDRRWTRLVTALRTGAARQTELYERMWLLQHPWEEDYLHWVGHGEERRLHGSTPPPQDGRRYSVTHGGWCRGLGVGAPPPGMSTRGRPRGDGGRREAP